MIAGWIFVVLSLVDLAALGALLHWHGVVAEEQRAERDEIDDRRTVTNASWHEIAGARRRVEEREQAVALREIELARAETFTPAQARTVLEDRRLHPLPAGDSIDDTFDRSAHRARRPLRIVDHDTPSGIIRVPTDDDRVHISTTPNPPRGYSTHAASCASYWVTNGVRGHCTCKKPTEPAQERDQ